MHAMNFPASEYAIYTPQMIRGPMLSIITLMHFMWNIFEHQFYGLA